MDRIITVTGAGKASATPDIVRVEGSLIGRCERYADAVQASSESISVLKAAVASAGFDPEALRTTGLSVRTAYRHVNRDGVSRSEFDGFEYEHAVRMTVDADEGLGRLLEALLGCDGAPEFHVSYRVSDPTVPMREARQAAVGDAAEKARELADAAGVALGDMVSISYVSSPCNFSSGGRMMMASMGSDITPEDVEFNDSVTIEWEIH